MKILLIKAMAEAHAYSQFVNALEAALRELGHEPVISHQAGNVRDGVASNDRARPQSVAEVAASCSRGDGAKTWRRVGSPASPPRGSGATAPANWSIFSGRPDAIGEVVGGAASAGRAASSLLITSS